MQFQLPDFYFGQENNGIGEYHKKAEGKRQGRCKARTETCQSEETGHRKNRRWRQHGHVNSKYRGKRLYSGNAGRGFKKIAESEKHTHNNFKAKEVPHI